MVRHGWSRWLIDELCWMPATITTELIDLTMTKPRYIDGGYRRLVGDAPNLIDHLLNTPRGEMLVITRSNEPIRDLDP